MLCLLLVASLFGSCLSALLPHKTIDGCPPIQPGDIGICAFMCGGLGSTCNGGGVCCPTACGGTTCVHHKRSEKRALCAPGVMTVNCFVSPCMFAKCPAHPTATCKDDYCGGCNAHFYLNGHQVTC